MIEQILMRLPENITIEQEGHRQTVDPWKYVIAKREALAEFGYTGLSDVTVAEQLEHALADHDMSQGLDVIGMFIKGDLVKVETQRSSPATHITVNNATFH